MSFGQDKDRHIIKCKVCGQLKSVPRRFVYSCQDCKKKQDWSNVTEWDTWEQKAPDNKRKLKKED